MWQWEILQQIEPMEVNKTLSLIYFHSCLCPVEVVAYVQDYLISTPQFVNLNWNVSDINLCKSGVPEGTILSPFIY